MLVVPRVLEEAGKSRLSQAGKAAFAVLLTVTVFLSLTPRAEAGSYGVQECFPTDFSAPDAVYATNGSLAFTPSNICGADPQGVGIGTQGNGLTGPLWASWTFAAPAGSYIRGVNFARKSFTGGTYGPLVQVCTAGGSCNGFSNNIGGPFNFVSTQFGSGDWSYLSVFIGCGSPTCNAGGFVGVRDLFFTVEDVARPAVASLGGSLLAGGPKRGVETLDVSATDAGSGVRRLSVRVNGAEVDSRPLACQVDGGGGFASRLRPCGNATETFHVNTESPAWVQGQNLVEVCAFDYTTGSSPNQGCAQRTVTVDNSCPSSAGTQQASSLEAGLQKQGPTSVLAPAIGVRSSEGVTVRGDLDGAAGPVAGANVCLFETIDAEGEIRNLAQVTKTRSDGTFAVQVEPGPSRNFQAVYRFNNKLVETSSLHVDSSVLPTLSLQAKGVLENGQYVGFVGSIPGPRASGRPIALQARVGKKWRTFKQIRTDARGRYRGRYRFTNTRGLVSYTFRARVKRQDGYPYSPGSSQKRTVRVRG